MSGSYNTHMSYILYKKYKCKYQGLVGGRDGRRKGVVVKTPMVGGSECAICLDEPHAILDDGDCLGPVDTTCDNCHHEGTAFHKTCLQRVKNDTDRCPICRGQCTSQPHVPLHRPPAAPAPDVGEPSVLRSWLSAILSYTDGYRPQQRHPRWGLGTPGHPIADGRQLSPSVCFCQTHGYSLCYHGECTECVSAATGLHVNDVCLGGEGQVKLQDNTSKLVKELRVGDWVESQDGYSKIRQVINSPPIIRTLCQVDGVILTHRHPIYREGVWCHPRDVVETYLDTVTVYNFVMDGSPEHQITHTIIVNGLTCATIGCGPVNLALIKPETDAKYGRGFWHDKSVNK